MPDDDATRRDQLDTLGIEACIPALRRYGRTLLRDAQEVDDLVHDCLVRALERLETRRSSGDLRAWLFAIMHNLFVSRTRRARVRGSQRSIESVPEDALSAGGGQESRIQMRDLLRALDAMPLEQRSVLVLVSVEDLSYAEVAQVLDIPIGTVMSRLSRARERLADAMDDGPAAMRPRRR